MMQTLLDNPTQPHQPVLKKDVLSTQQFPLFWVIVTVAVTLAVFSSVLNADFVMWDDDVIIYKNPNLGGLSLDRIYWAFTDVDSMMRYNPLTLLSWTVTYHFFGLD
ncbi:MAG: hypothetical protein HGB21_02540, partial [Nitrospirae bacterium]|nr:hypothetical protein [Nitrospirota bacterium]